MAENIDLGTLPETENNNSNPETVETKQGIKNNIWLVAFIITLVVLLLLTVICSTKKCKLFQFTQSFCPDKWISLQNHCYYFSKEEKSWNSSKDNCTIQQAHLTMIDTKEEMDFLKEHKCTFDHWIGLKMEGNQTGKWVNGNIFNQLFKVRGNEVCAYLSDDGVATARCYTERRWICRKDKSTK